MISWTIVLITLLAFVLISLRKKWPRSPPGPAGLPFVGNMFQMEKLQHKSFSKWAKEFGPIFKVEFANLKMVVISDHKMVKGLFSQSASSGRLNMSFIDFLLDGNQHGVINSEGPHWEEVRNFTRRQLRDFGFGKNTMQESIMTEVNEFIELIEDAKSEPVKNLKDRLVVAVVNSLWFIATGNRHKQNDAEIIAIAKTGEKISKELAENGGVLLFLPGFSKLFPRISGYNKIRQVIEEFATIFQKPLDEHIKTYSQHYERDFMDAFLKEIYAKQDPNSAFYKKLGEQNLAATLGDLYIAGSDTTSTALSWIILYLSRNPEIQKKLQEEIETITGNTRSCSVSDRPDMPYTEALLAETLRFSSILPVGLMHKVLTDTEFNGYLLPKDAIVIHNAHYIHHDPEVWGDPEQFRPERFLSPDGKTFKKHEALMPFSTGRRQCLGETLARDTLFLFSTNVFQRFTVEFDQNGPDNGFEPEVGFVLAPKLFHVTFKDRTK